MIVPTRCRATRGPWLAPMVAVAAALASSPLAAQQEVIIGPQPAATQACLTRIPAKAMRRVEVSIFARMAEPIMPEARASGDALAKATAGAVRRMLGGTPDRLPEADSVVGWLGLGHDLVVTAFPNGRLVWHPDTSSDLAYADAATAGAGATLLARALEELRAGGLAFKWPNTHPGDSLTFRLAFESPMVDRKGKLWEVTEPLGVPAFTVNDPWRGQVKTVRPPRVSYPEEPLDAGAQATVVMTYVVDVTGRPELATVRDAKAAQAQALPADHRAYYERFVRAVRRGIGEARYDPAVVGGCPVRQLVQQPFEFHVR